MLQSEDPQWYSIHDPGQISMFMAESPVGPWKALITNVTAPTALGDNGLMTYAFGTRIHVSDYPYWKLTINCRGSTGVGTCNTGSHSWIKEVAFM